MTVEELMNKLKDFPPDAPVLVISDYYPEELEGHDVRYRDHVLGENKSEKVVLLGSF